MNGFIKKCRGVQVVGFFMLLSTALLFTLHGIENAHGMADNKELGKKVYENRCLICHGIKGDGKGLVGTIRRAEKNGRVIEIYPRDLTVGVFMFRTTPTGCLPVDEDLLMTIENGVKRSFMPSHEALPKEEKEAVKEYIKTLSERWEEEDLCEESIEVKKPGWVGTLSSVEKGKEQYELMKCWECHGHDGKGHGPSSDTLKDDAGNKSWPFDFTTGELKRGSTPENVYLTFTTGLDGTPMPSYGDTLGEEARWHLVSFTLQLMKLDSRAK